MIWSIRHLRPCSRHTDCFPACYVFPSCQIAFHESLAMRWLANVYFRSNGIIGGMSPIREPYGAGLG